MQTVMPSWQLHRLNKGPLDDEDRRCMLALFDSGDICTRAGVSDATGKFKVKAELVTYSDHLVVLQHRGDKKLVGVPVDKLSADDQQFVKEKLDEATPAAAGSQPKPRPFRNGQKAVGKVVDYGASM